MPEFFWYNVMINSYILFQILRLRQSHSTFPLMFTLTGGRRVSCTPATAGSHVTEPSPSNLHVSSVRPSDRASSAPTRGSGKYSSSRTTAAKIGALHSCFPDVNIFRADWVHDSHTQELLLQGHLLSNRKTKSIGLSGDAHLREACLGKVWEGPDARLELCGQVMSLSTCINVFNYIQCSVIYYRH